MKNFSFTWSRLLCSAALPAILATGAANAQDSEPEANEDILVFEEILVTSRRRVESLIDVPATVTTFTAQAIEDAGVTEPRDFMNLTSNVQLVETQNTANAFIVIRGISQARNSEPSVAVIIDGVQQTNASQFSQQLFDIEQIEVLKGPQGALYGRNAIGGAIVINTKQPTDELEGQVMAGIDSGFGYRVAGALSGPLGDSETLKFRLSGSYYDTNGFRENEFLGEDADPVKDTTIRGKLLWQPGNGWDVDLRGSASFLRTQGLFFNIVNDVNDTSLPIQVNNPGEDNRDTYSASLKVQYENDFASFSSITSYDYLDFSTTGDAFDFKPIEDSLLVAILGLPFDQAQSQYFRLKAWSQEFKITSNADSRLRWILGGYMIGRDRFIATGSQADFGAGVLPIKRDPITDPNFFSLTFLSDSQDNFGWAVFGDLAYDITEDLELNVSLRYDNDEREQTVETPTAFLPNVPGFPQAQTGDVRSRTFDEWQPKFTLRYSLSDNASIYGGYSRGFRSGGFNQTGVGPLAAANGLVGVGDIFEAEVADTYEVGFKGRFLDGALTTNFSAFQTDTENSYFFVFLQANSTQNLGTIPESTLKGFEFDAAYRVTSDLDLNVAFGFTDSEIKDFPDASAIGNQLPLVSRYTLNLGMQYAPDIGDTGLRGLFRVDYRRTGPTWWEPFNTTERNPVDLVDARIGIEGENWSLTAWAKNLFDAEYNTEFSPGGFVYKALPARYGLDLRYRF